MNDRLRRFVRTTFRDAGRQYAEARRAYRDGRNEDGGSGAAGASGDAAEVADLPRDDRGRVRLVCRRHAERRAVALDGAGRPDCFEAGHPDCEGCAEDVREGVVETW